jgi:hypothetical protein
MPPANKQFTALIIVFLIIGVIIFLLKQQLADIHADYRVILGANALFFLFGIISLFLHIRALSKTNPNVFVRSVMISMILKLFGAGAAAFIYISSAGKAASTNAVLISVALYFIYTLVEKRATIQLSKTKK